MRIQAGTSGFSYKAWKGNFYPEKLPAGEMLRYYGEQLPAVEINNTFYRIPKREVLERWAAQVPDPVLGWFFGRESARTPERGALLARLRELAVGDVLLAPGDARASVLSRYGFSRTSENAYTVVWSRPD